MTYFTGTEYLLPVVNGLFYGFDFNFVNFEKKKGKERASSGNKNPRKLINFVLKVMVSFWNMKCRGLQKN